jgi:antitoxin component YwqK of YwqJK toxin-antitoxin module
MAQGTDWYFSDGAAIRYAATTEQAALASGWALSIQKSPNLERIIHFRDGRPITSWLRSLDSSGRLSREAIEEDGRIVEERLFNTGQQLNLERFFLTDGSVEETTYIHDGSRLVSSTQFKGGISIGSRVYIYYPDGRLAGVREQTGNQGMPTGMERPRTGQTSSWTSTPVGLILSFYDNSGRLALCRTYRGAVLVSTEERVWRDGRLISLSTERHEDSIRIVLSYDEAGRVESSLESRGKEIVAFHEFEYDQDGRLVFESRETPEKLETLAYEYNEDGSLLAETRILNGLLSHARIHTAPDEMLEEYYDKGKLFARVWYRGGQKVRETIISDGKIVRDRSF